MRLFDLHCDTVLACEKQGKGLRHNDLQLDLERMKRAGGYAQCFAIFLDQGECREAGKTPYERYREIYRYFCGEISKNRDIIARAFGRRELEENEKRGRMSAVLTVEGGEVLEGRPERLEQLYKDGVRLLTLTWNYENEIGYSHLTGGGLKPFGFEVVERMNELGMVVDVSHLSDEGFYDVLKISKRPVAASHSCARGICPHSRNLTDDMLRRIGENGGVVGLNFYSSFLDPAGEAATLELLLAHAKRIVRYAGEDALALGSDYDGIDREPEWKDYGGMQRIAAYFQKEFSQETIEKICYRNATRLFS